MEEAGVGGGQGGESAAVFDGGEGGGVGVLGLDLEGHLVGEDGGGCVLSEDVGALGDGPEGGVVGELDFVGGGLEVGFELRGQPVEDEAGAAQESGGGVGVSDGVFFAFGLEEDESAREGQGVPEVEADEEPGGHHLSGLGDDDQGVGEPEAREVSEVCSVGKELDGVLGVVGVEGVAVLGDEDPRVPPGEVKEQGLFEVPLGKYPAV